DLVQRPAPPPHHAEQTCARCGIYVCWLPKPGKFKRRRPRLSQELRRALTYELPFGKHKGRSLREVPLGYLRWMTRDLKDRNVAGMAGGVVQFLNGIQG